MTPEHCMDCEHHRVILDSDPTDSFNDDDMAIVCTLTPNPKRDLKSEYLSHRSEYRSVSVAVRPYNLKKEDVAPSWCPLKANAAKTT